MTDTKELFRPLAYVEAPDVWDRVGVPRLRKAPTPRHRKVVAIVAAALVTSVIVAVMVAAFTPGDPGSPVTSPTPSIPPDLHGQALIDALALPVIDQHDTDCKYIFDFEGPYYCLDSVADTKTEALALWNQVIDASSGDAALDAARAALSKAVNDLAEATRHGDHAAIRRATEAYNHAQEELGRLLQGDA